MEEVIEKTVSGSARQYKEILALNMGSVRSVIGRESLESHIEASIYPAFWETFQAIVGVARSRCLVRSNTRVSVSSESYRANGRRTVFHRNASPTRVSRNISVMTLNCNSLLTKKGMLSKLLYDKEPTILLLQESLTKESNAPPPRFGGYSVLERRIARNHPVNRGRGLTCLFESKSFKAIREIKLNPSSVCFNNLLVAIVELSDDVALFTNSNLTKTKKLIVANVYIPHSAKEDTIFTIDHLLSRLKQRFSGIPIIIAGDWNSTRQQLRTYHELSHYNFIRTYDVNEYTFFRIVSGVRRQSSIDHILTDNLTPPDSCCVLTDCDFISDHLPVFATWSAADQSPIALPPMSRHSHTTSSPSTLLHSGATGERNTGSSPQTTIPLDHHHQPQHHALTESSPSICIDTHRAEDCSTSSTMTTLPDQRVRRPHNTLLIPSKHREIVEHIRWPKSVSQNVIDGDVVTPLIRDADEFTSIADSICHDLNLFKPPPPRFSTSQRKPKKPRKNDEATLNIMRNLKTIRREITIMLNRGQLIPPDMSQQYTATKKQLKKELNKGLVYESIRFTARIATMYKEKPLKDVYDLISSYSERRWSRKNLGLVDPQTGELVTDPMRMAELRVDHFASVARDVHGHGAQRGYWYQDHFLEDVPERDPIQECLDEHLNSLPIDWVIRILKDAPGGKAPGKDGISYEFLKASLWTNDGPAVRPTLPHSPMLLNIYNVLKTSFCEGIVFEGWKETVISPVPKKGDPTDLNNYRGIALMSNLQKVISTFICKAILEKAILTRLGREQAGFRSREEAVAQVATLYQILDYRSRTEQQTFLAFIDLEKAYDSVPHGALLMKLERFGLRGRALEWIRALYQEAYISVKLPDGGTSSRRPYKRGVRQGDPLSPYLFNIFIEDLLTDEVRKLGVSPDGNENEKIVALLFADDIVFLAPSISNLQKICSHMENWCNKWEMRVNVSKCGIMMVPHGSEWKTIDLAQRETLPNIVIPVVRPLDTGVSGVDEFEEGDNLIDLDERNKSLLLSRLDANLHGRILSHWKEFRHSTWEWMFEKLTDNPITIHGSLVPVVKEYVYLGLVITPDLNMQKMLNDRARKCWFKLSDMRRFLSDTRIPFQIKSIAIRSTLLPVALYGAEVYSMNKIRLSTIDVITRRAIYYALGGNTRGARLNLEVGRAHFNIENATVMASYRRARIYFKSPFLNTHAQNLQRWRSVTGDWLHVTRTWITKANLINVLWTPPAATLEKLTDLEKIKLISESLKKAYIETRQNKGSIIERILDEKSSLKESSKPWEEVTSQDLLPGGKLRDKRLDCRMRSFLFWAPIHDPSLLRGVRQILRFRSNMMPLLPQLRYIHNLPPNLRLHCPSCRRPVKEDLVHILFVCTRYSPLRTIHKIPQITPSPSGVNSLTFKSLYEFTFISILFGKDVSDLRSDVYSLNTAICEEQNVTGTATVDYLVSGNMGKTHDKLLRKYSGFIRDLTPVRDKLLDSFLYTLGI